MLRAVSSKVWMSTHGEVLDPKDAAISVFDRGFLYGDSVYETMRTAAGRVVELGAHLDRLRRSAAGIEFELPFADAELEAAIAGTLAAAANPDSRIRVIATRGTGPMALDTRLAKSPVLVVIVTPLELPSREDYLRGISACVVGRETAVRPGLKTGNYLGNILALSEAHDRGADDAILCNADGAVAEAATSNLFMVSGDTVHTPSLATGLLAGITRGMILDLLRELDVEAVERTIQVDELGAADELFLTSSVRGVMPVTTLDGAPVGAGQGAGPLTRRLLDAYARALSGR